MTEQDYAARVRQLTERWETSADRIAERAFMGDPSAAIAHADALRSCAIALRAALDADAPAEPHQPGEPHDYRLTCAVCGEKGTVRVSVEPTHGATVEPSLRDVLPLLRDILDHLTLSDEYHAQPCSCAERLLALLGGVPLAGGDIAAVLAAVAAPEPRSAEPECLCEGEFPAYCGPECRCHHHEPTKGEPR
jgi:hypothetical protein